MADIFRRAGDTSDVFRMPDPAPVALRIQNGAVEMIVRGQPVPLVGVQKISVEIDAADKVSKISLEMTPDAVSLDLRDSARVERMFSAEPERSGYEYRWNNGLPFGGRGDGSGTLQLTSEMFYYNGLHYPATREGICSVVQDFVKSCGREPREIGLPAYIEERLAASEDWQGNHDYILGIKVVHNASRCFIL